MTVLHNSTGGRGSFNDMGGPVITTQVTIPKDVSTEEDAVDNLLTCPPRIVLSLYGS